MQHPKHALRAIRGHQVIAVSPPYTVSINALLASLPGLETQLFVSLPPIHRDAVQLVCCAEVFLLLRDGAPVVHQAERAPLRLFLGRLDHQRV